MNDLEVDAHTNSDLARHGIVATSIDKEFIHLDVGLRVNLALDFTLPLGSGEIAVVVGVTCGGIHILDVLRVQEVQNLEIDVHEGIAARLAFLLAEGEVEVLVNAQVETEGGRDSGTVVGTFKQVVAAREG